ncbi:MAG TPA: site-specific integrase [Chloroflexia bacterium]|nr:site-specific integrase [Chloroflexia bacterium]
MKGNISTKVGKRGTTYTTQIDLPPDPITGKRRQKRITGRTKHEVDAQVIQVKASIASGGFAEADAAHITVGGYLARWLEASASTVRPGSQRRYEDVVRLHLTPIIGRIGLAKLTPLDVQRLYQDRLARGQLSPATVNSVHVVLHKALKQAMRWGLLTRNVTEAVDPPRRTMPVYATWTQPQVAQFLKAADAHEHALLWRLALLTGMRRGEILGLRWDDVDTARGQIAVRQTRVRGADGHYEFGEPKTQKSKRSIAIPPTLADALRKLHITQHEERLALGLGEDYNPAGLVFTNGVGQPLHPNSLAYQFGKLIRIADVPVIRFHDLRHTSATLMLANGEHPKIVQERLGHSNISMTLDRYSHVSMDMQREAADRLDLLIRGTS